LSPGQAAYVLDRLIRERRISRADVNSLVAEMGREISELEARLTHLRQAHGGALAAAAVGVVGAAAGTALVRRGRRPGRPPGRRGRPPASASAGADASAQSTPSKGGKRGRKQRASITPEQLASRQLQGRYLALVRQFPAAKRAQYARTAKEKGREAAIGEMQSSLKK
jgi:hypothetical protein